MGGGLPPVDNLRRLVRRMWWRGMTPDRIADVLELPIEDVHALLFVRVPA